MGVDPGNSGAVAFYRLDQDFPQIAGPGVVIEFHRAVAALHHAA
jgi:hypothetical protein